MVKLILSMVKKLLEETLSPNMNNRDADVKTREALALIEKLENTLF